MNISLKLLLYTETHTYVFTYLFILVSKLMEKFVYKSGQ